MIEKIGQSLIDVYNNLTVLSIVDIVLLTLMFYLMFRIAQKYNSSAFIMTVFFAIQITLLVKLFDIKVIGEILTYLCSLSVIIFIILFRTEIKREIWKESVAESIGEIVVTRFAGLEHEVRECIDIIIKACQSMSKRNVGALIVIVPQKIPMQIAESGTILGCDLSTEIIENIFTPNTPLHDGAMLISGNQITAAGCFLPLTQDTHLPKELGTRHRAGIGITEMADVLSIIVSEESGVISVARRGSITRYADAQMLTKSLEEIYGLRSNTKWQK